MKVTSIDGKIIGNIENGVFTKKVNGKVHMLRDPLAWAVDMRAWDEHIKKGNYPLTSSK